MEASPNTIVAFLFTDVEGSTDLWQREHEAMVISMATLDRIVLKASSKYGGHVVGDRGEGDSHFLVFRGCSDAVVAAAEILTDVASALWPSVTPLKVRVGIHIGEVDGDAASYHGACVSQTARLRSLAHGGQAVTSRSVAELSADRLPSTIHLRSLGLYRVRNWSGSTEVFQVCREDLQSDFPALRSEDFDVPAMGAVVVLDIAGSTSFARNADHHELVTQHRKMQRRLRRLFDGIAGRYYQSLGDGCMVAFETPDAAIQFALRAREDLHRSRVQVRVAIDFGALELFHAELGGHPVYLANELCGHANVGDIVVTTLVKELAGYPEGDFNSLGATNLKSTRAPVELFAL